MTNPLTKSEIAKLAYLAKNARGSDIPGSNKGEFKRLGKKLLRKLAEDLGLEKGSYEIRFNAAGIAVTGESTLHGEHVYVQIGWDTGYGLMYRSCNGRKDYSGGPNNWFHYAWLAEPDGWERFVRAVHDISRPVQVVS